MKTQTPSFYFKKLNPFAYEAMDKATNRCIERSNPELELAHWMLVLAEAPESDVALIVSVTLAAKPPRSSMTPTPFSTPCPEEPAAFLPFQVF